MENHISEQSEGEIALILNELEKWGNLFNIKSNYFIDGWSIELHEKGLYPRYVVIFKLLDNSSYTIKSFEVVFDQRYEKNYRELMTLQNITSKKDLIKEIKEIIYGKDLFEDIRRLYETTIK